ncbi:uncharacterized protein Triagg1_9041 [Trichoderma aggressivum f. europaeum]|uniref:F-box domain-containing protein n=1 Tax=Trichoderma aggressivum f. europaeum TaxID=173218 RepID=A0AAE1LXC8_9HYPO|nr:hypothetical protein Triagg1_9041 [Trichoderma aggressivum f. europaeum]
MNFTTQPTTGPQGQRYSRRPGLRNSAAPLHQRLLSKKIHKQQDSPLFSLIPPEVRAKIFTYALSDYEDRRRPLLYDSKTSFWRPSHRGPRRTSPELLRTCRAIYRETRFLPFALKEQIHWLCADLHIPHGSGRSNGNATKLALVLGEITQQGLDKVEIESLHAFANTRRLEHGDLGALLSIPGLHPRRITLTIRYIDWWGWDWESPDKPLYFKADWISAVSSNMSPSTTEFRIELETLEHLKDRVDAIGQHIAENWFFGRFGGTILYADVSGKCHQVSRWSGSSAWYKKHRTNYQKEKGRKLDYYILTITFESELSLNRKGGVVSETAKRNAADPLFKHVPANLGDPSILGRYGPPSYEVPGVPMLPIPMEDDDL